MRDKVLEVLEMVRPRLAMHRGDVELVEIHEDTGVVEVRLLGTCQGCPLSELTLKAGIEALMREYIPEVNEVIAVP